MNNVKISDLPIQGKTIIDIQRNGEELIFEVENGDKYKMYHSQSCCEHVSIEDINGDLSDLIGVPLILAQEVRNEVFEKEFDSKFNIEPEYEYGSKRDKYGNYKPESFTWTFYKFRTTKGSVDIRWFGESNGYYSESVDFILVGGEYDYGY